MSSCMGGFHCAAMYGRQLSPEQHVGAAGGSARAAVLDWTAPDGEACRGPYSLVLGADLVYSAASIGPLAATLGRILEANPGCQVLLAHCSRHADVDRQLFDALAAIGLRMQPVAKCVRDRRVTVYSRTAQTTPPRWQVGCSNGHALQVPWPLGSG